MATLGFAPYAPPGWMPEPEKPTAAASRINRALAAVMWAIAIATVAFARHYVERM